MPAPCTSRESSLRGMGLPTHANFSPARPPLARLAFVAFFFTRVSFAFGEPARSVERGLQSVNQLLQILLGQWFEQSARERCDPPEDVRPAAPEDFRASRGGLEIESGAQRGIASGDFALPFIHGMRRLHSFRKRQLHGGRAANVRNPHAQLDEKTLVVLNGQTFVVRE